MQKAHSFTAPVRLCYLSPAARALYAGPQGTDGDSAGLAYATPHAAGLDLRACLEAEEITVPAGGRVSVPTGIAVQPLQAHVAGFIYSRSGLGAREGLTVAQGVGVVDNDYRGEILVMLLNTSGTEKRLRRGERMAQLVFQPVIRAEISVADALDDTERGAGGFGHTGSL